MNTVTPRIFIAATRQNDGKTTISLGLIAALKQHFINYLGYLGKIKLLSTDHFAEIDDAIFFEATVETEIGIAVVYDVFTFKDGKAIRHFTGVKEVRPKA